MTPQTIPAINRFISETVQKFPDRFAGFAAIHPKAEDIDRLVEEVRDMRLMGFKIHPDMQKFALDDSASMEMFSRIEGRVPIIIQPVIRGMNTPVRDR